jgi:hypothetical protein
MEPAESKTTLVCVDECSQENAVSDIFLERRSCIVCNHSEFKTVNSFRKFPIMAISNNYMIEYFFDFVLIACDNCTCLQLKNQVDPSILYSDVYMSSYFSPSWKDHHSTFANFILNNTTNFSFLEIGANRGDLYKLLSNEKNIHYTTLDMFQHPELPPEVTFIHGDCNSFNFSGFTTVIASHVFEHLYSPRTFIENLRKVNVSEVFISIPNFDTLLQEQSPILIHSQHIYYCGFDYIVYMFSLFNYRYDKYFVFDGNFKSHMFKFVLDTTISPLPTPSTNIQLFNDIYIEKIQRIKNFPIPPNCYIAPSGIYGQFLYYFLNNNKNIVGFLDNNSERHGKKLYGTDKLVFDPQKIDYMSVIILLCDCPYKQEIMKQLRSFNKECRFIEL